MDTLFYIAIFGLLGIFSRYGIDRAFINYHSTLPLSTFLINILGSFIAGLLFVFAERGNLTPALQTGLLVGFCGGFTTFSAYSLQTMVMLEDGKFMPALSYLILSPLLGLLAAYLPVLLKQKFF